MKKLLLTIAILIPSLLSCYASNLYTARIVEEGWVRLSFNEKNCAQMAAALGGKWKPEALTFEDSPKVLGINNVVQVLQGNNGGGVDPFLYMRNADGHVAILSIADVLTKGDMNCSGPLAFITGVTDLKETTEGEEGTVVKAVCKDGSEVEIPTAAGTSGNYIIGDGYRLDFSPDWNIDFYYPAPKGVSAGGTFQPATKADFDADRQRRNFVAAMPTRTMKFTIEQVEEDDGINTYIEFTEVPERLDRDDIPGWPLRVGLRERLTYAE